MIEASKDPRCRVCGSSDVQERLYAREMMFGLRERFAYFRCASCGCLQHEHRQADLGKYYPNDYYSFTPLHVPELKSKSKFKRAWLYPSMTRHKLGWRSISGRLLCSVGSGPKFPGFLSFLAKPIPSNGGVLDVGCGAGAALLNLRECGFSKLQGVDPFIPESLSYPGDIHIAKSQLEDIRGKFSLIMFHHVFEHLEDPLGTLRQARQRLAPGGQILIRIPLSDSYAAQKYRENWVQLDAPRHITLHTRKSMQRTAELSGMKIARVTYDSTDFQFWGSEQYLLDIPLRDKRSYGESRQNGLFSDKTMKGFGEEAERLNNEQAGDQAAFVLV